MSSINNNIDIQQRLYKKVSYLQVEKLVREASNSFVCSCNTDKALLQINEALAIEPDNVKGLVLKGNILFYLNKGAEALEYFNRAISIDPACSEAYGAMAGTHDVLGNYKDALYCCEMAFDNLSDREQDILPALYDQKIAILVSMKRFEQAKESLKSSVHVLPEEDSSYLISCYQSIIESSCREKQRKRERASRIDLKVV